MNVAPTHCFLAAPSHDHHRPKTRVVVQISTNSALGGQGDNGAWMIVFSTGEFQQQPRPSIQALGVCGARTCELQEGKDTIAITGWC